MISLKRFGTDDYADLISWINNEELLVQIAGRQMTFPVTQEQLDISQSDKNRIAFSIISEETGRSIGHCELYMLQNSAKIDRLIIGDQSMKGKGLCVPVIKLLLEYGFNTLDQQTIELNVFDWNEGAIRCYEKAGFIKDPDKTMEFQITGKEKWIAFNMRIQRSAYIKMQDIQN